MAHLPRAAIASIYLFIIWISGSSSSFFFSFLFFYFFGAYKFLLFSSEFCYVFKRAFHIISRISKCCVVVEFFQLSSPSYGPKLKLDIKMTNIFAKSHGPMVVREKPRLTCNYRPLMRISVRKSGYPTLGQALEHSRFSSLSMAIYSVLYYVVFSLMCTYLGLIRPSDIVNLQV